MNQPHSADSDGVLRYGGGDLPDPKSVRSTFGTADLHPLSLCTTPIELLSNDGADAVIGRGTGFFVRRRGRPHLVTNYHVVSGRNPFNSELISPMGYLPKRIRYFGTSIVNEPPFVTINRIGWILELDEQHQEMLSKPPVVDGVGVDVWAIPIQPAALIERDKSRSGFKGASLVSSILDDHLGPPVVSHAGSECMLLGYPLSNYNGFFPPIWKRGSLASEPLIGVDGRPIFLIDASTTPSMSGSPVIRRVITFAADNRDIGAIQEFSSYSLLGVYAGRLQSANMERVNLGYAWRKAVIDAVLDHYKYGDWTPAHQASNSGDGE